VQFRNTIISTRGFQKETENRRDKFIVITQRQQGNDHLALGSILGQVRNFNKVWNWVKIK
jgi:hypothetical protein